MWLDDLEDSVDPLILMRGREYYQEERVVALEQSDEGAWSAQVQGTERYQVHVEWNPEGEFFCQCSCPYDRGPVCKHVIAVLYAIQDLGPDAASPHRIGFPESKSEQVEEILEGLPRADLVKLLVELAAGDREIAFKIRARYGEPAPDKATYLRMAREALRMGENRHRFISYWGAARAAEGLDALLSKGRDLLRRGDPGGAVPIAQAVLETTAQAYGSADDSMGVLSDSIAMALHLLQEAGCQLKGQERRALFDYCLQTALLEPYRGYGWEWDLAGLAARWVAGPEDRARLFAHLDAMAERRAVDGNDPVRRVADYDRERAAEIKLSLIQRLDGAEAGWAFIKEHIHLDAFRRRWIEHLMARGDWAEIKALCAEALESHAAGWPGIRRFYLDTLLQVARREEDSEEILRLARTLLVSTGDMKYFVTIKGQFDDEQWPEALGSLIEDLKASVGSRFVLAEIYAREGMWDALLEAAQKAGESILMRYRDELEKRFPQEVSEAYEGIVYRLLERTSDRGTYAGAADYLRRMVAMGHGERAAAIIDDLIAKYRRRRAMVEELEAVRPG